MLLGKVRENLRILREVLHGIPRMEADGNMDTNTKIQTVVTVMDLVAALDLYLTDSCSCRTKEDGLYTIGLVNGGEWTVELSDGESKLILRRRPEPTGFDEGVVKFDSPLPRVRTRWSKIDTPASQPVELV